MWERQQSQQYSPELLPQRPTLSTVPCFYFTGLRATRPTPVQSQPKQVWCCAMTMVSVNLFFVSTIFPFGSSLSTSITFYWSFSIYYSFSEPCYFTFELLHQSLSCFSFPLRSIVLINANLYLHLYHFPSLSLLGIVVRAGALEHHRGLKSKLIFNYSKQVILSLNLLDNQYMC
jgi:hypothetical protein